MLPPEEIFVRRYQELAEGLRARDDFELLNLAAALRQLLLDGLVHRANEKHRLRFRFRVNDVESLSDVPVTPDMLFHGSSLDPTMLRMTTGTLDLTLEQFLAQPVVETPDGIVKVSDVIRFAANKAGGVHYDPRRSAREEAIDQAVTQLARLGVHLLAISLVTIARVSLVGLRPLYDAILRLPELPPLLAHYRLDEGAYHFEGRGQFLQTALAYDLQEGLSWNGIVRIMEQAEPGRRVVYELGNVDGTVPRVTLFVDEGGSLGASALFTNDGSLEAVLQNFRQTLLYDRFTYVGFDLDLRSSTASLRLLLNNVVVAQAEGVVDSRTGRVTQHTIGADLIGSNSATFQIRELIIATSPLEAAVRTQLARYFWLRWHD